MASDSYPRPGFNSGEVTEQLYERLTHMQAPDGVFGGPADPPVVYADGVGDRTVRVMADRLALLRGFQYDSGPTDIAIQLPTNTSGTTRQDLIVLRLDRATWRVQETFVQGTPGQAAPPPVDSSSVFDLPLASVQVEHNATTLAPSTVTPLAWYVGSDGQIRCTPDTRPPHETGRVVWEHPTDRWLVSVVDRWLVAAEDDSAAVAAASGFTLAGADVRRRNGFVTFEMTLRRPGAQISPNVEYRVATVPEGFRPVTGYGSVGICPAMQGVVTYSVDTDGAVLMNPGAQTIPANTAVVLAAMTYAAA